MTAPSTWAANADLQVTVSPVPVQVSVGRSNLITYAAYNVNVSNLTSNVINQVVFNAATSVVGATATAPAPYPTATFVETQPQAACVATSITSVSCNIGQLRGTTSFVLIFKAPALATGVSYDASTARIDLNYSGQFSNAASPTTPTAVNGVFQGLASTSLVTTLTEPIRQNLKTYIPTPGGTFFTGSNATALEVDVSTTRLKVPPGLGLKTAEVVEVVAAGGLTNDVLTTHTTAVTVPSPNYFSEPVTIELRRDASTIRVFSKIGRAYLDYSSSPGEPWQVTARQLFDCAVGEPNITVPVCISARIGITRRTTDPLAGPVTVDDEGDWLFIIKALQNGNFRW